MEEKYNLDKYAKKVIEPSNAEVLAVCSFMLFAFALIVLVIALVTISLFVSTAKADTVNLTLHRVHSPNAVEDADYDTILDIAKHQLKKDLRIKLNLVQKDIFGASIYEWYPDYDPFKTILLMEFRKWAYWGEQHKLYRNKSYGWVLGGAVTPEKYQYSWGLAHQGCAKKEPRYFTATAIKDNGAGANRIDFSAKVLVHELLHTLGARHTTDCSLMDRDVGHCYKQDTYIPVSKVTKRQVKRCLRSE